MEFSSRLVRGEEPGAWCFAPVPEEHAPDVAGPFGRVPVVATVDGSTWATSVWRGRDGSWLLAVPARVRRGRGAGDVVTVEVEVDRARR